jgi:hypothetical protein
MKGNVRFENRRSDFYAQLSDAVDKKTRIGRDAEKGRERGGRRKIKR